jgi:uncharacterized integral membrane protein
MLRQATVDTPAGTVQSRRAEWQLAVEAAMPRGDARALAHQRAASAANLLSSSLSSSAADPRVPGAVEEWEAERGALIHIIIIIIIIIINNNNNNELTWQKLYVSMPIVINIVIIIYCRPPLREMESERGDWHYYSCTHIMTIFTITTVMIMIMIMIMIMVIIYNNNNNNNNKQWRSASLGEVLQHVPHCLPLGSHRS